MPTTNLPNRAPWTVDAVEGAFERASARRCECCHERGRDLYLDAWGEPVCAECVTWCSYCDDHPVTVSARRPEGDCYGGMVDHVCESCLLHFWQPGQTLLGPAKVAGHMPHASARTELWAYEGNCA